MQNSTLSITESERTGIGMEHFNETDRLQESKSEIRKRILCERDHLSENERIRGNVLITERILGHQWFCLADVMLGFISYGSEIDTKDILAEAIKRGKKVYVPKVTGNEMDFYRICSFDVLTPGYKGIPEPPDESELFCPREEFFLENKCLMLMPGVAFDLYRNRIGYGKGFYDRYLERFPYFQEYSIAIGYKVQMVEQIHPQLNDKKPYQVICV